MRTAALLAAAVVVFAGCISADPASEGRGTAKRIGGQALPPLPTVLEALPTGNMTFTEHVVTAAVGFTNDLYEPTMEVSDTGVIYVTGHTILVDTTGAPVFMSKDDGKSWSQLPFLASAKMPEPIHGATPPPSDEIFLLAGENGWLYGVDITAVTFPINAWSGNGAAHAYHNPNAYNRVDSTASVCGAAGLNDRPWGAYAKGKLLLVNNPGGGSAPLGRVEVGVMDVPPALPVGIGAPVVGAKWNYCATVGGSIPGIPGMRDDHFFAVPQVMGSGDQQRLIVVTGNAKDVMNTKVVEVFKNTNNIGGTINNGHVTFDKDGTMFVAIRNTTRPNADGIRTGQLHIAVSRDDAKTFQERTFVLTAPTTSVYIDGNMKGPGALITWAQQGQPGTDWYAGHLFVGRDGAPVIENVSLVVKAGPGPSAHVMGAAAGPDGRAYMVTFHGGYMIQNQARPLHVWVQREGSTLPIPALPAVTG